MREHPDHHDAELLLRLYDLRREETLRKARAWLIREFRAESLEELRRMCPPGSPEHAYFRMTVSYWDMAASMVNHGLIKEEFFFENTNECWIVWRKVSPLLPALRTLYENPFMWKNLETLAERFEKWMKGRAPGALEALQKLVVEAGLAAKK